MLFLITLEDLETRYTAQWRRWIKEEVSNAGIPYCEIDGSTKSEISGANFLDPNATNIYKSEQIIKLARLFAEGKIKPNDIFLFYDAWHYGVIALRYMSVLNNIPIKQYGMMHAGSYDPNDLLGQKDKAGTLLSFERALVGNLDEVFVATHYHEKMMIENLGISNHKVVATGFPYNFDELDEYKIDLSKKENLVVFPHRLSIEKNPNILKNIKDEIDGEVIFCQEKTLSKDEYHKLLARSKIVFSANDQETWGLGVFEAMYLGNIPVVPDRLSYIELYSSEFRYSDEEINNLPAIINERLRNYSNYLKMMENNIAFLKKHYCTFRCILGYLK